MGKTSRIRLAAFDGEYEFQLRLAGVVAIEEKAGCGIGAVYGQIMRGRFRFDDGKEFGAIQPSILFHGQSGGPKLQAVGRTRQGKVFTVHSDDAGRTWGPLSLLDLIWLDT